MKYEVAMPTQLVLIRWWNKTRDSTGMLLQFLSGHSNYKHQWMHLQQTPYERKTQTDERYEQYLKDSEMIGYSALSSTGY